MVSDPSVPPGLTSLRVRFYGALKDFLGPERTRRFSFCVKGHPSVKDVIESLGVPHPEVDAIGANGRWVDFSYQVCPGDDLRVYSHGSDGEKRGRRRLRARLPRTKKFVLDAHLGKLVRHLRLLGFDCLYDQAFSDREIVDISLRQRWIVLTRDVGLLKNRLVVHGYWIRSPWPQRQLVEVISRFDLGGGIRPFLRCLQCNGRIFPVSKTEIEQELPDQVRRYYRRFYRCRSCRKVYWKGSHFRQLSAVIRRARRTSQPRAKVNISRRIK